MTPREDNILNALNILVLVYRSQKQMHPTWSEVEKHTLKITKEHLATVGLDTAVFINTLAELNARGYLYALSVFEEKYHPEILKFLDDAEYSKMIEELESLDTSDLAQKLKVIFADMLEDSAPSNLHINREELLSEDMDIRTLLETAREGLRGYNSDVVSTIVLSPFRSIERLLEKLNEGISLDSVKDAGVWYDPAAYELHADCVCISTKYQSKPTKAHFALQALFKLFDEHEIDYVDIPEFDLDNREAEKKSYRDSLNRLLNKHPNLKEIFGVHTGHLSIQREFLEHTH